MRSRPACRPVAKGLGRPVSGGKKPGPPPAVIDDLFKNGEQGIWLDPTDLATMFQDKAGTVPVTAAGQPVGLIRDKSGNGNHAELDDASYALDVFGKPYIESGLKTRGTTVKSLDFSTVNQITFWVGVTNYVKERMGGVFEHGSTAQGKPGAFSLFIPGSTMLDNKTSLWFRGDSTYTALSIEGDEPPYTAYYTGSIDSIAPLMRMRKNGHDKGQLTDVKGGRMRNEPLSILTRGVQNTGFEGRLYQLVLRGGPTTYDDMLKAEGFVAAKMAQVGPLPTWSAYYQRDIYRRSAIGQPPEILPLSDLVGVIRATSGGRINEDGKFEMVPPNTPRLNHEYGTKVPLGILVEPTRTNLVTFSNGSGAGWQDVVSGAATIGVTPNGAMAPDGSMTATVLDFSAKVAGESQIHKKQVTGLAANSSLSPTIWVRADVPTTIKLRKGAGETGLTQFNVTTDWVRLFPLSGKNVATSFNFDILGESQSMAADGRKIEIWGVQLEIGDFATTTIPTQASQVTRNGDQQVVDVLAPWFNQSEGTLYAEGTSYEGATTNKHIVGLNDGTAANWMALRKDAVGLQVGSGNNSGDQSMIMGPATPVPDGSPFRAAFAYALNDCAFAANGVAGPRDNSALFPTTTPHTRMVIGTFVNGTAPFSGHIRNVVYWPVRQSIDYLQEMTK